MLGRWSGFTKAKIIKYSIIFDSSTIIKVHFQLKHTRSMFGQYSIWMYTRYCFLFLLANAIAGCLSQQTKTPNATAGCLSQQTKTPNATAGCLSQQTKTPNAIAGCLSQQTKTPNATAGCLSQQTKTPNMKLDVSIDDFNYLQDWFSGVRCDI